jgi:uncharacterized repeat protein (TIGR01451 family)
MSAKKLRRSAFSGSKIGIGTPEAGTTPASLLAQQGTTLVVTLTDSISGTEATFTDFVHSASGRPGDRLCVRSVPFGAHHYNQYFFRNESAVIQKVTVGFTTSCSFRAYMAAYSPQFSERDICANFIASAGRTGSGAWDFTVCPNSQFSLVVYEVSPGLPCAQYSFSVFASDVVYLGTMADLAISKEGPAGPVGVGSTVSYTITVSNLGPSRADNVVFTDPLPPGTTFALLSVQGTAFALLPTPGTPLPLFCTTPPLGSSGSVTCNVNLNPPFTPLPYSVTVLIGVTVTSGAGPLIVNTATVSRFGIDPFPGNNSSTVITAVNNPFDICIQDDASGSVLKFNSTTGDYQFLECGKGVTLTGRGTLAKSPCKVELQDDGPDPKHPDRRVRALVNPCTRQGSASVFISSSGQTVNIADSDILNNTCNCQ